MARSDFSTVSELKRKPVRLRKPRASQIPENTPWCNEKQVRPFHIEKNFIQQN